MSSSKSLKKQQVKEEIKLPFTKLQEGGGYMVKLIHQHFVVICSTCNARHTLPISITLRKEMKQGPSLVYEGRISRGAISYMRVPVAVVDVAIKFLEDGHLHLGWDASVILCSSIKRSSYYC